MIVRCPTDHSFHPSLPTSKLWDSHLSLDNHTTCNLFLTLQAVRHALGAAAAALQIHPAHPLDSAHQNLARPAVEVVKTDVRPAAEMACSAADFPQHPEARTEVEETACSAEGTAGFLEEAEGRRGRREEAALEEAFHVLLVLLGPQHRGDQAGRTEGKEVVVRRLRCRAEARVPWGFGAWDFVPACPGRRSRRLCCQ